MRTASSPHMRCTYHTYRVSLPLPPWVRLTSWRLHLLFIHLLFVCLFVHYQWRIQDFPDAGCQRQGVASLLFGIIFAENCMKMKKLDWEEGARVLRPPNQEPPLIISFIQSTPSIHPFVRPFIRWFYLHSSACSVYTHTSWLGDVRHLGCP